LYVAILELGDGGPMFRKEFLENDLNCVILNLKRVKVPRDITLEKIRKFFGLVTNKNGYSYEFTKDPIFIKKVERLWMVVHQKACVPTSRLISFGMAQGLACDKMGKPMNLAMYAEWINLEQQRCRVRAEQVDIISSNEKLDCGPYTVKDMFGQVVECLDTFVAFDFLFHILKCRKSRFER